mmetsp:Transcript_39498/g.102968  ORF Transcript_39498/g.102968 Transcript_39498/m.102968 type:complete len:305 (-) Transcript_39498:717-1631(-)
MFSSHIPDGRRFDGDSKPVGLAGGCCPPAFSPPAGDVCTTCLMSEYQLVIRLIAFWLTARSEEFCMRSAKPSIVLSMMRLSNSFSSMRGWRISASAPESRAAWSSASPRSLACASAPATAPACSVRAPSDSRNEACMKSKPARSMASLPRRPSASAAASVQKRRASGGAPGRLQAVSQRAPHTAGSSASFWACGPVPRAAFASAQAALTWTSSGACGSWTAFASAGSALAAMAAPAAAWPAPPGKPRRVPRSVSAGTASGLRASPARPAQSTTLAITGCGTGASSPGAAPADRRRPALPAPSTR